MTSRGSSFTSDHRGSLLSRVGSPTGRRRLPQEENSVSSNLTRRTISPCSPTGRRRLLEVQNSVGSNPTAGTIRVCSPTGRRHLTQNENSGGSNPPRRTTWLYPNGRGTALKPVSSGFESQGPHHLFFGRQTCNRCGRSLLRRWDLYGSPGRVRCLPPFMGRVI